MGSLFNDSSYRLNVSDSNRFIRFARVIVRALVGTYNLDPTLLSSLDLDVILILI